MNELSDRDWDLINAYHDGELEEVDARDLEVRLASEPSLARALKEVRQASASLAALRPATEFVSADAVGRAANHSRKPAKWLVGGVTAAMLALAVVMVPRILAEPTALDIHAAFTDQAFSIKDDDVRLVASTSRDRLPDLASANLTPVAFQTLEAGDVAHYAGRNGCRLSYFRGIFGIDATNHKSGQQVETWTTTDNQHHMIIASGMDQSKFDAIAAYLKSVTRQRSTETMLAAMSDATTAAVPCVG